MGRNESFSVKHFAFRPSCRKFVASIILTLMKLLLLGSGGREHALAWKIAQSAKVETLYIAPGNAGTAQVGENVAIKADDFDAVANFVVAHGVDMVVVGPEDPLVRVFTTISRIATT